MKDRVVHILVLARALYWLCVGPQRRKFQKFWVTYQVGGLRLCWYRATKRFSRRQYQFDYKPHLLSPEQSNYLLTKCSVKPLFSIITPVYKVERKWLEKCICSVVCQHYRNWELILVDDASRREDLKQLMNTWALRDSRVRTYYLETNCGIAGATNFGIRQAKGEFIGVLDHDDELTPDALTWVVWALKQNPDALWFYSDEDKILRDGRCHLPYFKPDFSPEFLLSNMYTCHFRVYSTAVLSKVGGLREGFDGSQDHDLALRLSEIIPKENVTHIPRVLYHWREIPGSAAIDIAAKLKAPSAGRKAVAEALKRRNLKGRVTSYEICPTIYQIELEPSVFPKVSIIIPTKNALSLTKKCINSVRKYTSYPDFEIVVIDNASDDPEFLKYIRKEQSENRIKVVHYNKPFNHSEMNNVATASVDSEFVLFMNNDIEVVSEKWLEQLVAVTELDESIAVVGGFLVYPNGTVQHSGIILGLNGVVGHAHKFVEGKSAGYFGRLCCLQEMSGVTAALSLVRRAAFEAVGGFNSERYPTSFNDVDFCIRLRKQGFRCLYNPMVKAIHSECATRPITEKELIYQNRLTTEYADILRNDPFYNPNLALDNEQFRGFRQFPVEDQIPELANMSEDYRDGTDSV